MATVGAWTNYGLSMLASALQGNYSAPLYLVLEGNGSTVASTVAAGATSIESVANVWLAGDDQLVLGAGLPTQEVVTYSSIVGTGPYTYNLTAPTTQNHTSGDPLCRVPLVTDTLAQVVNELQYDSTNAPGLRLASVSGYSTGTGNWTMQFYLTGIEASAFLMTVGLSDNPNVGQGNLHAHFVLGVNHVYNPISGGVDIEIDVPLTL